MEGGRLKVVLTPHTVQLHAALIKAGSGTTAIECVPPHPTPRLRLHCEARAQI